MYLTLYFLALKGEIFLKNFAIPQKSSRNLQTNKGKMMQRFRIFLVVLLLMFTTKFFGQNIPQKTYIGITIQEILTRSNKNQSMYESIKRKPNFILVANTCIVENSIANNPKITTHPYYLKNFLVLNEGILCIMEYKFQRATAIPLRFRLGSLDYTNYLEQKPNALKPN